MGQVKTFFRSYFEVDMSIWKAISTSFIQKINVFDQQAEEGDHNL